MDSTIVTELAEARPNRPQIVEAVQAPSCMAITRMLAEWGEHDDMSRLGVAKLHDAVERMSGQYRTWLISGETRTPGAPAFVAYAHARREVLDLMMGMPSSPTDITGVLSQIMEAIKADHLLNPD